MREIAFLFDMDGTIVDNMSFHTRAWQIMLAGHGIKADMDALFRDITGHDGVEIVRSYLGADVSNNDCVRFNEEKELIYRELYAPHRKLAKGLLAFVQGVREAGIRLALATSAPDENIRFILDELGVRSRFDVVVGARDVKRGKPYPDVFLHAAAVCGVDPAACVVFEDTPLGVEAAARAGMAAVALTTTLDEEAFDGFDNVICMSMDFRQFNALGFAPAQTGRQVC